MRAVVAPQARIWALALAWLAGVIVGATARAEVEFESWAKVIRASNIKPQ